MRKPTIRKICLHYPLFIMAAAILLLIVPARIHAATDKEKAASYYEEATNLNKQRRFDEAIDNLLAAIRLDTEDNRYHRMLFITYISTRRGLKGIETYKNLAKEFPNSPAVHYWLGRFYLQSQSFDDAVREFRISTRLSPKDEHPWISLGHVYWRQGKDAEAFEAYTEANRLSPNVAVVHGGLGNIYYKRNQYDKAMKEYEVSLKLDPSSTEIRYNLSLIYEKTGKIDEAAKQWAQILDDDPNETPALERLARYYYKKGRYAEAVQEYTMLTQLRQSSTDAYLELGESQILWAASLDNQEDRTQLMDAAAESFQHVLLLDPKNEKAKNYLDRLKSKTPSEDKK